MSRKLIVVTGLLAAVVAVTFDTNVAEAGRCCRSRRSCGGGYWNGCNNGCNTGYNTGWQNGCAVNACQATPGGRLIADPNNPAAPQAEVVAPPPPDAAPAPAPGTSNNAAPPPPAESAKVQPEGETGTN